MFIIASEQTRAGSRCKNTWTNLASPEYLLTNLETDLDQLTESLATFLPKRPSIKVGKPLFFNDLAVSRIMGMLDTRDHDLSFDGEDVTNVVCERIFCHERLTSRGWMVWSERGDHPLMSTIAMVGETNGISLRKPVNHI